MQCGEGRDLCNRQRNACARGKVAVSAVTDGTSRSPQRFHSDSFAWANPDPLCRSATPSSERRSLRPDSNDPIVESHFLPLHTTIEANTISGARFDASSLKRVARRTTMHRIATAIAASALLLGVLSPWQAQAQMERGPAALAGAAQNYTPIEKAAC